MKRALSILAVIAITALITYLAISKHLAEERAANLDRQLMDAETRLAQLEADIEAATDRISHLTRAQEPPRRLVFSPRKTSSPRSDSPSASDQSTAGSSLSVNSTAVGASAVAPVVAVSGPWIGYRASASGPGFTNLVRIEGTASTLRQNWQVAS